MTMGELLAFLLGAPVWGLIAAAVLLFMQSTADGMVSGEGDEPALDPLAEPPPPKTPRVMSRIAIFGQLHRERERQDAEHGPERDLPFAYPGLNYGDPERVCRARYERRAREGCHAYADIVAEEYAEAVNAETHEKRRDELVQLAASVVKAIEAHDWQQVQAANAAEGSES